ncbi:uncharacterized protein ACMZJ9_001993 [Mantella aurantiaca]
MTDAEHREWAVAETHALLDLIQDGGFLPGLKRKGYLHWDVYERLSVLLNGCNIKVSMEEVKTHWQLLKDKFWKQRRMVDGGVGRVSGLTMDFPFYREMERLLTSQRPSASCKREADSSGLEDSLDPKQAVPSTKDRAEDRQEGTEDAWTGLFGEGLRPSQYLERCVRTFPASLHEPGAPERLQESLRDMKRAMEQLNSMSSAVARFRAADAPQAHPRRPGPRRVSHAPPDRLRYNRSFP